jgi:WD40 repeat protein
MGTLRAIKVVRRGAFDHSRPYEREFIGIQRFEPVSRSHEGLVDILQIGRDEEAGYFYYVMEVADEALAEPNVETRNSRHAAIGTLETEPGKEEIGKPRLSPALRGADSGFCDSDPYVPKTLAHQLTQKGRLPAGECINLAFSLAGAVAHLHKHGLIHRDIKPSNIIFVHGVPKLADIGLVSEVDESHSYVGTEGYIPPEGPGTRHADLYSLGKVIYEASTGKDRTQFPSLPVEMAQEEQGTSLLELNSIFLKACAQQAQARYQTAEEMQQDLALLQAGKSIRRMRSMERQVRFLTRAGVVGTLITALALGAYAFAHRQARLERESVSRIERAEKEARLQLRQSLLAQARALRHSGQGGRRYESLEAIARAAAMPVPTGARPEVIQELRDEAAACLVLADLRVGSLKPGFPTTNVSVDPALDRYAYADPRGAIQIRRVANDELLVELASQPETVAGLSYFSPNLQFLPVMYADGQVMVWDLSRGAVTIKTRPQDGFRAFDFSHDSRRLAVGEASESVVLYDLATGRVFRTITNAPWARLSFSPDNCELALASGTNARIIQIESGQETAKLAMPFGVLSVAWHPLGKYLALGERGPSAGVLLWRPSDPGPFQVFSGHQSAIAGLAFHPEGNFLASSSWDGTLRLWDLVSDVEAPRLPIRGDNLKFTKSGEYLISYRGGSPTFCEAALPRSYRLLRGERRLHGELKGVSSKGTDWSVAFGLDDRTLASAGHQGVRLWDLTREGPVAQLSTNNDVSVFFHPTEGDLYATGESGLVRWPASLLTNYRGPDCPEPEQIAQAGRNQRACMSPRGDEVAYALQREVRLLNSGARFDAPGGTMWVTLSADLNWVATSGWGSSARVRLWNVQHPEQVRDFPMMPGAFIAFSPDSRWLITGDGGEFCFHDVNTGKPGRRIPRRDAADFNGPLAFSRDGKMLAIALSRTEIQLLDAETFAPIVMLHSPTPQMISWIAFSPSGQKLAVATATSFIQVWDLSQLRQELVAMNLDW